MAINSSGSNTLVRLDMSRSNEYLKADYYRPKMSFFQKVGRFLGKATTFLGPIAGAVVGTAVPGVGLPISAGLYGLSNLAGNLTARAEAKDAASISTDFARVSQNPVIMPGFFDQSTQADIKTSFVTPDSMVQPTMNTILNREFSSHSATEGFQF